MDKIHDLFLYFLIKIGDHYEIYDTSAIIYVFNVIS